MKSRVHPTYKTKYRVANWASYDRALVGRGDVTLWLAPEAIDAWAPGRVGTRGGQFKYSDLAIRNRAHAPSHLPPAAAPPTKASSVSRRGRRSIARDRTIRMVKELGRRRWKQEAGYQRQARAENAFFRYKSIIGDGLRARTPEGRVAEALLACNLLNQVTALGRPESYGIGL